MRHTYRSQNGARVARLHRTETLNASSVRACLLCFVVDGYENQPHLSPCTKESRPSVAKAWERSQIVSD